MIVAEALLPRRQREIDLLLRWPGNFGVAMLSTFLVRLIIPATAAGVATATEAAGFGLFNNLALPLPLTIALTVVFLDLIIYWQHRLFHAVPLLWRIHRMHHTDIEFDATTALRFHPFEIVLSMLLKLGVIVLLGAPAVAVIVFEIVLNGSAIFNHSNVRLPDKLDRALRAVIVTPDMHRVHHSTLPQETNSNFGFFLSCWDRWFGSYIAQPQLGHEHMRIGLAEFRDRTTARLDQMLINPFVDADQVKTDQA
ncbi:MAG: sterol desaturase family protein [Gammaproteobacteria bacterium]|nr:sterol desaturase family protein [Gammaproteobacteria bacterium]NND55047.1 sterol desaturase family protein [Gammaproteobacteria bacterium]